jgi:hypothetical protein
VTAQQTVSITYVDDRTAVIKVDGMLVATAEYEAHGWAGMAAIIAAVATVADELGARVVCGW